MVGTGKALGTRLIENPEMYIFTLTTYLYNKNLKSNC